MTVVKQTLWMITLIIIGTAIGIWNMYAISYRDPMVTSYAVDCGVEERVHVVLLSDLHDMEFGQDNAQLVDEVQALEPDMICMVGDMLNEDSPNHDVPVELVQALGKTAPVYYSWGNHELALSVDERVLLQDELEAAGAVVLEKNWIDLVVKEQQIRVGGLYDYAFSPWEDKLKPAWFAGDTAKFLSEFQDTDAVTVLLAHRPDSFIFENARELWNIDLVLSGHLHGGQVRLPVIGGIFAPDQGWFPDYAEGLHRLNDIQLVISRGLGTTKESLPRWNNPPEIASIEMR